MRGVSNPECLHPESVKLTKKIGLGDKEVWQTTGLWRAAYLEPQDSFYPKY